MIYTRLICSNCSNPTTPEFRPFIINDKEHTITCENCNRKLRYTKPKDCEESWYTKLLESNKDKIEHDDTILEVLYVGDR